MVTQPWDKTDVEQVEATAASSGSGNAAVLDLGPVRRALDVWFDVENNNGDIVIEVSTSGEFAGEEREIARVPSGDIDSGGEAALAFSGDTTHRHVRTYAANGFADADVNELAIVSRGA